VNDTYPYRLRLVHEGGQALRLERRGPTVLFDPVTAPSSSDIVVLTGPRPEQVAATARAIAGGARPRVVGPAAALDWLRQAGLPADRAVERLSDPDGLEICQWAYPAPAGRRPEDAPRALLGGLLRPRGALRRVLQRREAPAFSPQISRLTLPDGARVVHLGLALNRSTDAGWLASLLPELVGAEWLLLGSDSGQQEAVFRQVADYRPRHLLLVDLVGDARRAAGLPVELLTPLADRLCASGLDAYVLPSGVSYRFEAA
jgi:hypothetical protein